MIFRFIFFFGIGLFSQTAYLQNSNQIKTFENEEFYFNYPVSWTTKEIRSLDISSVNIVTSLIKNNISELKTKNPFVVSFIIYEEKFNHKNLGDFIDRLRRSSHFLEGSKINVKTSFTKINNKHYSSIRRTVNSKKKNTKKVVGTNSFVHYRLNNDKLYSLDLTYSSELAGSIVNEAILIFDSFQFKG